MNKNRLHWFRFSLVLLPVFLILLAEFLLRILNLFPQKPLFLETLKEGKQVFQLNSDVGKRYFDAKRVVVPNLYPETFSRIKPSDTFRIFCLGGSTTAGFPFDNLVPFPAQMKILLANYYPENRFEVINLGLSAISSYSVLDFIPEVLEKEPDLILLYLGHNEFYGAYGSASTVSMGENGSFVRFYLKLQKLHLLQMIRSLLSAVTPAKSQDPENTTLMEQVIADKKIEYQSKRYRNTCDNFKMNLSLILDRCRTARVPVMIGNLFSNVKDMPPLGSTGRGDLNTPLQRELAALSTRSDSLLLGGDFEQALRAARKIVEKDSLSADARFRLGKIYVALHDSILAGKYLIGAKDRDIVRFRASEDINQIIQDLAAEKQAVFVDVKKKLETGSPCGIIGRELICDHLHPNPNGYYLMAEAFAERFNQHRFLQNPDLSYTQPDGPHFITDLDWDMGLLRIYKLLHRWPFADKKVDYRDYKAYGEPAAVPIAHDYLFNHFNWVRAHYAMADFFNQQGGYEKARREYLAINCYYPNQYEPLVKIAVTYEMEQDWGRAEKYYQSALLLAGNKGLIYYQMALAQWKQKKMAAAVQNIQMAIVAPELTVEQRIMAKYNLAGFFIDLKRKEYALKVVEDILNDDPNFAPAREMLNFIK